MKIEWLIANMTANESSDRAECAFFGGDFALVCFWPIKVVFVVWEPLCVVGTPLEL